jgi:toxin ParE1/3/4
MAGFNFTALAAKDLRDIGRYTRKTWGLEQARRYREELELALQKLALTPSMGLPRLDIAPRVRSFPVASHVAFYVARRGGITVLRLLHPRQDVARLPSS